MHFGSIWAKFYEYLYIVPWAKYSELVLSLNSFILVILLIIFRYIFTFVLFIADVNLLIH